MIVSEGFPDEDAKLLRDVGHKVITPRSIEKGQKIIDKALRKKADIPDAIVVDSGLKGAQFFAKALKISLQEGGEDKDIYLVVNPEVIGAIDPEYFGISGFIEAPLGSRKLLDLIGIPEGPVGEREEEEAGWTRAEPGGDEGLQGGEAGPSSQPILEKITMTTAAAPADAAAGAQPGEGRAEIRDKAGARTYRLAFSAVLGAAVLAASAVGFSAVSGRRSPPAAELPNFYGMDLAEAESLASSCGLSCEVEYVSSGEPPSMVLCQYPAAGTPVDGFDEVALVVANEEGESEEQVSLPHAGEAGGISELVEVESGGALMADAPPDDLSHSPAPPPSRNAAPAPASGQAPVARIAASSTSVPSGSIVSLSASASYDPDGGPLSYSWSCGGSGPSVSRELVSNIVPEAITVTVTVTDDEGRSAAASVTINVY